jgi:predicted transglutaminase-like cysteine proteinase
MRVLVQLASILLLVLVCDCASGAAEHSHTPPDLVEIRARGELAPQTAESASVKAEQSATFSRLALLTSAEGSRSEEHTIKSPGPLDLASSKTLTRDVSAKWADLQSRMHADEESLTACRFNPANCSAGARRFLQIVELGRQRQGRARLGEINRAVNISIRPTSDWLQYSVEDFWSAPLATLETGAGDCEDYAILKYMALREAGIDPGHLRLLIVRYPRRYTTHAVLAVHLDEQWLLLDNLTLIMANILDARHYIPLFALDRQGVEVLG